jgi:hypothetical protein
MSNALSVGTIRVRARKRTQLDSRQDLRGDYFIAAVVVIVFTSIFVFWNRAVMHWFIIPVMVCGILTGVDVVRWLRGRLDLFDPKTIVACVAFYLFFISPLLHVAWDSFGAGYDLVLFGDWRPWLAVMGLLNAVALIVYRLVQNWSYAKTKPSVTRWEISPKKFYPAFAIALTCSIAAVITFLWQLGGITGLLYAYESNPDAFVGKVGYWFSRGPLPSYRS